MLSQPLPGGRQALRKLVYGRARLLVLRVLMKIRFFHGGALMLSGRGEETVGSSLSRIVLALVFVS